MNERLKPEDLSDKAMFTLGVFFEAASVCFTL